MLGCNSPDEYERQHFCPKLSNASAICKKCEAWKEADRFWRRWLMGGILIDFWRTKRDEQTPHMNDKGSSEGAAGEVKRLTEFETRYLALTSKLVRLTRITVFVGIVVAVIYGLQLRQMETVTKATQDSASAAFAAIAQNKTMLDASIESSRLDQRAWLTVSNLQLTEEPNGLNNIGVLCHLINTGKTPALMVTNKTSTGTFTANTAPPTVEWDQILADNPVVVFPGGFTTFTARFNPFTAVSLDSYKQHRSDMLIRVRIDYRDVFGAAHFTESCSYHSFGTGLTSSAFGACKTGNEIDHDR